MMMAFVLVHAFFSAHIGAAEEDQYLVLSNIRRSGLTNEWWLPAGRFKKLPRWEPGAKPPPLSLEKAIQTARAWVVSHEKATNHFVAHIEITTLDSGHEEFSHTFFYRFTFGVGPFDWTCCVVLMDGTVLEPSIVGEKKVVPKPRAGMDFQVPNRPGSQPIGLQRSLMSRAT